MSLLTCSSFCRFCLILTPFGPLIFAELYFAARKFYKRPQVDSRGAEQSTQQTHVTRHFGAAVSAVHLGDILDRHELVRVVGAIDRLNKGGNLLIALKRRNDRVRLCAALDADRALVVLFFLRDPQGVRYHSAGVADKATQSCKTWPPSVQRSNPKTRTTKGGIGRLYESGGEKQNGKRNHHFDCCFFSLSCISFLIF